MNLDDNIKNVTIDLMRLTTQALIEISAERDRLKASNAAINAELISKLDEVLNRIELEGPEFRNWGSYIIGRALVARATKEIQP